MIFAFIPGPTIKINWKPTYWSDLLLWAKLQDAAVLTPGQTVRFNDDKRKVRKGYTS